MLDIVVYENKKNFIRKNIDSIDLSSCGIGYNIHNYDSYTDELESFIVNKGIRKVYILDDEVNGVSGIEVAVKIRKYDWDSIIILLINRSKQVSDVYDMRLIPLDVIFKDTSYGSRIEDDIKLAISIVSRKCLFTFKYNHIIYRIPYNQICYIEKESSVKRCIIHTVNNQYYIIGTINSILSNLNNDFCRTHQSCIINLNNVSEIDLSSNVIKFNNGDKTDMLSVKMKKVIKSYFGFF